MTLFAKAIAWYEEYAFLQGNGVGKPQGMLSAGHHRRHASHRQPGRFRRRGDDVEQAAARLVEQGDLGVFARRTIPQLLQLKDGANRAIFISIDQGATKSPNWSLLGRPAIPTEKLPALGTKGDLMLVDPQLLRHRRSHADRDRRQRARQLPEEPDDLASRGTRRRPTVAGQARHAPGRQHAGVAVRGAELTPLRPMGPMGPRL